MAVVGEKQMAVDNVLRRHQHALSPGQLPAYALVLGDSWSSCARDAHVAVLIVWVGTAIDRAREDRR